MTKEKRPRILVIKYVISDYIAAVLAWLVLFTFRKKFIETPYFGLDFTLTYDKAFVMGLIILPLFWLLLYYVVGEYHNVYRKSRLQELGRTIFITTLGVILIFFILILDDTIVTYHNYYQSFFVLLSAQFSFTYLPRVIITSSTNHKLHNHIIGFKTIIIGSNERAVQLYHDLVKKPKSAGNEIVGFVTVNGSSQAPLGDSLPHLGSHNDLIDIINQQKIEEVIIAIEPSEREKIHKILVKAKATNAVIKGYPRFARHTDRVGTYELHIWSAPYRVVA
jgi:FlaA1/EpsC-like NDP-sugar epimerase